MARIVIEDVSDELLLAVARVFAEAGVPVQLAQDYWSAGRAEMLLRSLPTAAVEIIRVTVAGDGWGEADLLRGEEKNASLRGRSSAITRAVQRGARDGRWPDDIPVPVIAQYDPDNPSFQRTKGFLMPEEYVPAFRDALRRLDAA